MAFIAGLKTSLMARQSWFVDVRLHLAGYLHQSPAQSLEGIPVFISARFLAECHITVRKFTGRDIELFSLKYQPVPAATLTDRQLLFRPCQNAACADHRVYSRDIPSHQWGTTTTTLNEWTDGTGKKETLNGTNLL